jgi:hypothetical protein
MPALLASVSRPQKTVSPSFQTPSSSTAVPLAPLATGVPIAERSYLTVASVAEVSVTDFTVEVTAPASGLASKALSADENCEPLCSSCTRLLFGVEVLKKVFQSAVMSATADAEPAPLVAAGAAEGGAAVTAGLRAGEAVELLEEQADRAMAPGIRPSIGIARYGRAFG